MLRKVALPYMKKVTIYDLAKSLNISSATVSRSLNNHPSISEKTREKVLAKAKEVGYRTNKFASNLSKQQSNTIGVIVPKLNSYFMSTVLSGIEKVANDNGYNLIISQSLESKNKEILNTKTLYDSGVDALLVSLAYETDTYDHFMRFIEQKIPLLFFDRVFDIPNCPIIVIDNELAAYEATEHLIQQGCKNIVHISGNFKRNVYTERKNGYKKALKEYTGKFNEANCVEHDLNPENVDEIVQFVKSSKKKIDGLFISSDTFAVHCVKALQNAGYKIPEDIKIIGFNNDPITMVINPTLTTIDYPGYKMGVLAGQSIINHLKGNIDIESANSIILKHKIITRESTQL